MSDEKVIESQLIAAIDADRAAGESSRPSKEMARIAIRHWRSFQRRNRSKSPTLEQRVADLAKGLKSHFDEGNYDSITSYLYLARTLTTILSDLD